MFSNSGGLFIALHALYFSTVFAIDLSLPKDLFDIQGEELTRSLNVKNTAYFPQHFYDQLIDHKSNLTFKQRYYVNYDHYKEGGAAFLMIGGEGQNQPYSVSRSFASELARRHGGIVYSLEHRYYGVSHPFNDTSVHSLRYLSSDYALKDIARFARNIINPKTGKRNNKWFSFGYSYSGMLSAWSRQTYPKLFYGALSSSAPVHAKEDFYEYDQVVRKALGPKCSNKIGLIVNKLDSIYRNNATFFKQLKTKADCNKISNVFFLSTLSDSVSHVVQYNKLGGRFSSESLCNNLTEENPEKLVFQFIDFFNSFLTKMNETCYSFAGSEKLKDKSIKEDHATRQWVYQCCTEFGYWQTSPRNFRRLRSRYLTVSWFNRFYCSNQFYSKKIGPPNTSRINAQHLGRNINTSRIIFTNGDKDPWTALSVSNTSLSRPDRPVIIIKDGSHTSDYLIPLPSNSKSLTEAYKKTFETFKTWLE